MKKLKYILYTVLICIAFSGCKKNLKHPCYDESLAKNHSGFCTMDCPGVVGCDGKTYCNSCEAARHGIRVEVKK